MTELSSVEVVSEPFELPEFNYNLISDPAEREWAESAAGYITFGLGQAVVKVLEAGNLLIEAKKRLAHGEYLPWVQQACGLKQSYAAKLIKAAEWVNMEHVPHLDKIADTATLFLLSADATPEDVRQWALERCAADDPPTRKEVQERKRQSQGKPNRTLVQEVKAALKISSEARQLAATAEHITTRQLMDELDLDDLPKGSQHQNQSHMFLKNGTGWWKISSPRTETEPTTEPLQQSSGQRLLTTKEAAELLGISNQSVKTRLTPSALNGKQFVVVKGRVLRPSIERGKCIIDDYPF
jgi:hypothetical protein